MFSLILISCAEVILHLLVGREHTSHLQCIRAEISCFTEKAPTYTRYQYLGTENKSRVRYIIRVSLSKNQTIILMGIGCDLNWILSNYWFGVVARYVNIPKVDVHLDCQNFTINKKFFNIHHWAACYDLKIISYMQKVCLCPGMTSSVWHV